MIQFPTLSGYRYTYTSLKDYYLLNNSEEKILAYINDLKYKNKTILLQMCSKELFLTVLFKSLHDRCVLGITHKLSVTIIIFSIHTPV